MQTVIDQTLESFNHQEAKMFLLTHELCASKLKLIEICYGVLLIPSIICILKIFGKGIPYFYPLLDNTNFSKYFTIVMSQIFLQLSNIKLSSLFILLMLMMMHFH